MPDLDKVVNEINVVLTFGNTVVPLAADAVKSIIAAIRGGQSTVDITVSLPSAEAEFQQLIDVADQWEKDHPAPTE